MIFKKILLHNDKNNYFKNSFVKEIINLGNNIIC